jgi:hypothetical protein
MTSYCSVIDTPYDGCVMVVECQERTERHENDPLQDLSTTMDSFRGTALRVVGNMVLLSMIDTISYSPAT